MQRPITAPHACVRVPSAAVRGTHGCARVWVAVAAVRTHTTAHGTRTRNPRAHRAVSAHTPPSSAHTGTLSAPRSTLAVWSRSTRERCPARLQLCAHALRTSAGRTSRFFFAASFSSGVIAACNVPPKRPLASARACRARAPGGSLQHATLQHKHRCNGRREAPRTCKLRTARVCGRRGAADGVLRGGRPRERCGAAIYRRCRHATAARATRIGHSLREPPKPDGASASRRMQSARQVVARGTPQAIYNV